MYGSLPVTRTSYHLPGVELGGWVVESVYLPELSVMPAGTEPQSYVSHDDP